MAARVHRAERVLDAFAKRHGITEDGLNWFKLATDTFHDTITRAVGYPDNNVSVSVPRLVPLQATISAPPAAITNNTPLDCHVLNMPFINSLQLQSPGVRTNNLINETTASPNASVGGVTIMCATAGIVGGATEWSASQYTPSAIAGGNVTCTFLSPDPSLYTGKTRVTGSAVEVYNTTASIYKQGSVTVYRTPVPDYTTNSTFVRYATGGNSLAYTPQSAVLVPSWPLSTATATSLRGSRTWDAAEGSYQVHVLHSDEIPCDNTNYIQPYFTDSTFSSGINTPTLSLQNMTSGGSTPLVNTYSGFYNATAWTKMDMSGAIYSGLSPQTTLLVRWNVMLESFPDGSQPLLTTLANPSPCYDPKAIELYSYAMQDMPVGVKVNENGLGDWFSGVINKVSSVIAPIASTVSQIASKIPHPTAQKVSMLLPSSSPSSSSSSPHLSGQTAAPNAFVRAGRSVMQTVRNSVASSKSKSLPPSHNKNKKN